MAYSALQVFGIDACVQLFLASRILPDTVLISKRAHEFESVLPKQVTKFPAQALTAIHLDRGKLVHMRARCG